MKKIIILLAIISNIQYPISANIQYSEPTNTVTIIPIKGPIEAALLYVVRRGIDDAIRSNSAAIIFEMDTPGGAVDAAGDIIQLIGKTDIPTYTYIDNGAYSAGAFIALASGKIYMAPGSVIGAATPMMMSPMGGVQDMPEEVKEKMTSAVAAMVRAAAEQGGHDPELAECMVRAELEYKVGRNIISKKGELLTLTNSEAEQSGKNNKPLLSNGTIDNLNELLTTLHLQHAKINTIQPTGAEKIARVIAKIAPILMLIGMGGLWLEFKTPGIGFFGLLGAICLLLFFLGHHIAGLSGMEDILLFLIGVGLIGVEIFITPGFGFMGLSGLLLIFLSLINAMVERMPGSWKPISFDLETFTVPLINLLIAFVGSLGFMYVIGKFIPKSRIFNTMTLKETVKYEPEKRNLIGIKGISDSDLRPSGTGLFGNEKLDIFTQGEFIAKNQPIQIISIKGPRIIVKSI